MWEYRLYTYDVWGNHEDGWEVNDVFPKQVIATVAQPIESDAEVLRLLAESTGANVANVEIDGADYGDFRFELLDRNTGKPLGYVEGTEVQS